MVCIKFINKVIFVIKMIKHKTIQNLISIENKIKSSINDTGITRLPKIIAVSKTFKIEKIQPLIDYGHIDFGENKVQEAVDKWSQVKIKNPKIQLHMIGKLQTNKVKFAVKLFDFIHSVDSTKLALKIATEQKKQNKRVNIFIQVNIGNESQKSGIDKKLLKNLILYCKDLNLNVMGLMCIPPAEVNPSTFFKETYLLNKEYDFPELSMGMSADYFQALENFSTYLRIGSSIFGERI